MIMRWISLVPSKIVKILAVGAVSAGQRPAGPVVSARIQHALLRPELGHVFGLSALAGRWPAASLTAIGEVAH
jgi:hypothetical protein